MMKRAFIAEAQKNNVLKNNEQLLKEKFSFTLIYKYPNFLFQIGSFFFRIRFKVLDVMLNNVDINFLNTYRFFYLK